ncbi:MAG: HepT-like ribonuclease domain-containing protein [bacterium]
MIDLKKKIKLLKEYFFRRSEVLMAFVFGSQAKKKAGKISDWDIAIYFQPCSKEIEWESNRRYPQEEKIWLDLVELLETDQVDLVVLNRASASVAASALQGLPLIIKDRQLFLEFMLIVSREAEDYRQTAKEYAEIYWRSSSLSEEDKYILNRRVIFLDSELKDAAKFRELNQLEYEKDSTKRREVERWIENLINAAIDITKIILASQKRPIPSTYKEVLRALEILPNCPKNLGEQLAVWAELRNILAHEYLDIRWRRIEDFIKKSESYFQNLIKMVKENFL